MQKAQIIHREMHKGLICIDFASRQKESFFWGLGGARNQEREIEIESEAFLHPAKWDKKINGTF